jgi:hypothetical protein
MKVTFCLILNVLIFFGHAQNKFRMRPIQAQGPWTHVTGVIFPMEILDYQRTDIVSFERKNQHVSLGYEKTFANTHRTVSVYIYPNEETTNLRLYNEFQQICQATQLKSGQVRISRAHPFTYQNNQIKLHGLSGASADNHEYVGVVECGKWMVKTRMTANDGQDIGDSLFFEFLHVINPSNLIAKYPWKVSHYITVVSPGLTTNETFAMTAMLGATTQELFILANIDSVERCAGIPGLYLKVYLAPCQLMLKFWKGIEEKNGKVPDIPFMNDLRRIEYNGFLEEFIMDEFGWLLIVPDDIVLDREGYKAWRSTHYLTLNLTDRFFMIAQDK